MFKKFSRAFTLVELLVVLSIITLLTTIIFAALDAAKKDAQDHQTISDVRQIQLGLELYYNQHGGYPNPTKPDGTGRGDYYCVGVTPSQTCIFAGEVKTGASQLYSFKNNSKSFAENNPSAQLLAAAAESSPRTLPIFIPENFSKHTIDGLDYTGYLYRCKRITLSPVCLEAEIIYTLHDTVISEPAGKIPDDPNSDRNVRDIPVLECGIYLTTDIDGSGSGTEVVTIGPMAWTCGEGWSPNDPNNTPITGPQKEWGRYYGIGRAYHPNTCEFDFYNNNNLGDDPTCPESGSTTGSDPGSDSGSTSNSGSDSGTVSDSGSDSGTASDPGSDSGTASDPGSDTGTVSDSGSDSGTVSDSGSDSGSGYYYTGCTDPNAVNYDIAANVDDGSCDYYFYYGCTNPSADNYDIAANLDDGSCTFNGSSSGS